MGGEPNWVQHKELEDAEWILQYLVALHWALTQFTPASMFVGPQNLYERAFNVVVLVFAMCVFSSFVSSITSAMTRLRTLTANQVTQLHLLKRFLFENEISSDLKARITRYVDLVIANSRNKIEYKKIEYLQLLSGPLHAALQLELFEPALTVVPYLAEYSQLSRPSMSQVCFSAVRKFRIFKKDTLFNFGEECTEMMIMLSGAVFYRRARGIRGVRRRTNIEQVCVLCEAVLWVPWIHRGTTKAITESTVVALNSKRFRDVTVAHPDAMYHAHAYALEFLKKLHTEQYENGHVLDIADDVINHVPRGDDADRQTLRKSYTMEAALLDSSSSSDSEFVDRNSLISADTQSLSQM